jgi:hypothetical protein
MAKQPYPIPIREMTDVLAKISPQDWKDHAFSKEKAYVCSVFSQWAYAEIPKWEMQMVKMRRVKLFNASSLFKHLVSVEQNRRQSSIREFIGEEEGGVNFITTIIDNILMVAVVLRMKKVIFISLRGTVPGVDFLADISAVKIHPLKDYPHCGFHLGFYCAIAQSFRTLRDAILKVEPDPLIYVTGHSLGGAMSGVLYGLWNLNEFRDCGYPQVHSAYTFGMPRFGDTNAMELLGKLPPFHFLLSHPRSLHPFHMLHPLDNVPLHPPRRFLDFADSEFERWACEDDRNGKEILSQRERDDRSFFSPMKERLTFKTKQSFPYFEWTPLPHHDIKNYIENINKLVRP